MFGKRGQGAMEYLMTYGWAILVVMIVGIVMWQLGIFNMGETTLTATGFAKIKPQLAATGLKANGAFSGVFTNGVGTTIIVNSVTVTNKAGKPATVTTTATVAAGENWVVSVTGAAPPGAAAGDVYNVDVDITYAVSIGDITTTHTEHGSLRGPYEA